MKKSQQYTLGNSTVVIRIGNILDSDVDVIVSSDDHHLTMGGGVSQAIRNKGGEAIYSEAQDHLKKLGRDLKPGEVVQTGSGALRFLKVLHAICRLDGQPKTDDFEVTRKIIERAVIASLMTLEALGVRRIAFPAIGAGYAKKPVEDVATAFAEVLGPRLHASNERLYVEIVLFEGDLPNDVGYQSFFWKFDQQSKWKSHVVRDHVVAMIHGIRTPATWHEAVDKMLRAADNSVNPVPLGYGYFDLFRFLWPSKRIRSKYIDMIACELTELARNPKNKRLSIIAHSYGTFLTAYALQNATDVKVDVLILCGSIVPRDFPWNSFRDRLGVIDPINHGTVHVLNDCGWRDIWPVMANTITWGYGDSGRFGFQKEIVKDRHHDLGHSDFFTHQHVSNFWVPAITNGRIVPQDTKRPNNFWVWILQLLTVFRVRWIFLMLTVALMTWGLVSYLR